MESRQSPSESTSNETPTEKVIGAKDNMKSLGSVNNSPTLTSSSLLMNTARLNATSIMSAPPGFFKRQDKGRDRLPRSPTTQHKSTLIDNISNHGENENIPDVILSSDDGGGSEFSSNEVVSTSSVMSMDLDEATDSSTASLQSQNHSKKLSLHNYPSHNKKLSTKRCYKQSDDDSQTSAPSPRPNTSTNSDSGKWNNHPSDRSDDTHSTGTNATDRAQSIQMCPATELLNYTPTELSTIMSEAVERFNHNSPAIARDYLVDKRVHQGLPLEMAQFIFDNGQRLNKRKIGEFIGKADIFHQQVCDALMYKYDFSNMVLDNAIRVCMQHFRLPGEAQKIDKILEKFANSYHRQNPMAFSGEDLVHILSFSIMMLNTDLHNQAIAPAKKMTLAEFKRNNRGIDKGKDVPAVLLETLYKRIKENEIRMHDNDLDQIFGNVNFTHPIKSGWLRKKSNSIIPHWKKRWFVLLQGCLYYFEDTKEFNHPIGLIPLDNTRIGRGDSGKEFILTSSNGDEVKSSKVVSTTRRSSSNNSNRGSGNDSSCDEAIIQKIPSIKKNSNRYRYVFKVKTEEERDSWVRVLQEESAKFLPLHDFFTKVRSPRSRSPSLSNIPKPIIEGWMKKRSSNQMITSWNRRYFVLFPDFDNGGITLFYYSTQLLAQRMIDFGLQTQQGYLRMRHVTTIDTAMDGNYVYINVYAGSKSWRFCPEPPNMLDSWVTELKKAMNLYLDECAYLEQTEYGAATPAITNYPPTDAEAGHSKNAMNGSDKNSTGATDVMKTSEDDVTFRSFSEPDVSSKKDQGVKGMSGGADISEVEVVKTPDASITSGVLGLDVEHVEEDGKAIEEVGTITTTDLQSMEDDGCVE